METRQDQTRQGQTTACQPHAVDLVVVLIVVWLPQEVDLMVELMARQTLQSPQQRQIMTGQTLWPRAVTDDGWTDSLEPPTETDSGMGAVKCWSGLPEPPADMREC